MARTADLDAQRADQHQTAHHHVLHAGTDAVVELPSSEFIANATMARDGADLVLTSPSGETVVIEGYFNADPAPALHAEGGGTLSPNLVNAFLHSPMEYASNSTANDESPVGAIDHVQGKATIIHADGTVETVAEGTAIYQGDVVETDGKGAINITFIDETMMAISENARVAVDQYTYNPDTEHGTTNISVLRGVFMFTSGLIGRDDPDDVHIHTPVGSIGIRGTIIAGQIDSSGQSHVSVLEGAIVVKNGNGEITLSKAFETVQLGAFDDAMKPLGVVPAADISHRFSSVSNVAPSLFSTINDTARDQAAHPAHNDTHVPDTSTGHDQAPAQDSAPTSQAQPPATQPTVPALAPMTDIVTLHSTTSNLPTSNVISGAVENHLGATTVAVTTTVTSSVSIAPPAAIGAGGTSTADATSTVPGSVTATAQQTIASNIPTPLLPPEVLNTSSPTGPATGTAPGIAPAPPVFTIGFTPLALSDITAAGTVIGHIDSGLANTSYSFASANPYFSLVTSGTGKDVVLTTAGHQHLATSLDAVQLGSLNITATHDMDTSVRSFATTVTDANASTTLDLAVASNGFASTVFAANSGEVHIGTLGDYNQDGRSDFAYSYANDASNQVHFIYGSNVPVLTPASYNNVTQTSNYHDAVVTGIGDFDGDGHADYVVGEQNNGTTGNAIIASGDSAEHLTFTVGAQYTGSIGASVAGVGDIDNDGYTDVVIGAPGANLAYVIHGQQGWTNVLDQANSHPPYETILSGGIGFGGSVTNLGDWNGDGKLDYAIGAPGSNNNSGSVSIFSGSATSALQTFSGSADQTLGQHLYNLGDINGDGLTDLGAGGGNDTNLFKVYLGNNAGTITFDVLRSGYELHAGGGVGDFNGDGYDDFTVSLKSVANDADTRAYVIFGQSNLSSLGSINLDYLKDPAHAQEIRLDHSTSDPDIKSVGDLNGDGYDDFAIGDTNSADAGRISVIYGHDTGTITSGLTASADNQHLVGAGGIDTFSDGGHNGVSMRGGGDSDYFYIQNTNFLGIHGGNGSFDTIQAQGTNMDFTSLNYEKISGIEKLQFGVDNQTITLSMENLFNLMKSSDSGVLIIGADNGASGAVVNVAGALAPVDNIHLNLTGGSVQGNGLSGSQIATALGNYGGGTATQGTDVADATGTFHSFNIGGYHLLVDTAIHVDAP